MPKGGPMLAAILSWFLSLPISPYDAAEPWPDRIDRLATVAHAITVVAKGDPQLAAFLAVQAYEESGLRHDVQSCACPPSHCDGGRAHGLWQIQPVPRYPKLWSTVCEPGLLPQVYAARFIAQAYRAKPLREAFAALGGALARPTDAWVLKRVERAQKLAVCLGHGGSCG